MYEMISFSAVRKQRRTSVIYDMRTVGPVDREYVLFNTNIIFQNIFLFKHSLWDKMPTYYGSQYLDFIFKDYLKLALGSLLASQLASANFCFKYAIIILQSIY